MTPILRPAELCVADVLQPDDAGTGIGVMRSREFRSERSIGDRVSLVCRKVAEWHDWSRRVGDNAAYLRSGGGDHGRASLCWPNRSHFQASTFRPLTRLNSPALAVTSVAPRLRAWAAMNRSTGPMGVPVASNAARISA